MRAANPARLGLSRSLALVSGITVALLIQAIPHAQAATDDVDPALLLEARGAAFTAAAEDAGAIGTYLDRATGELVAVLPPGVTDRNVQIGDVGDQKYRFDRASFNRKAIEAVETALRSVKTDLVYGFYFSPQERKVVVDVAGSKGAFAGVEEAYPDLVIVQSGEGGPQGYLNDSSPFEGATRINGPGGFCTSGFAVVKSGTRYLVTAGHCFGLGAAVTTPLPAAVGTVQFRVRNAGSDVELIGTKVYNGFIYNATPAQTTDNVSSAGDPTFTGSYCVGDSVGGTNCGETIVSLNATLCLAPGDCVSPLASYQGPVTLDGSSGAPFYLKLASSVAIRGHHIGRISGTMYAQKWSTTSSVLGATIFVP